MTGADARGAFYTNDNSSNSVWNIIGADEVMAPNHTSSNKVINSSKLKPSPSPSQCPLCFTIVFAPISVADSLLAGRQCIQSLSANLHQVITNHVVVVSLELFEAAICDVSQSSPSSSSTPSSDVIGIALAAFGLACSVHRCPVSYRDIVEAYASVLLESQSLTFPIVIPIAALSRTNIRLRCFYA